MAENSIPGAGLQAKADILTFSMAVHDLKGPLAILSGQSKLMLAEKLGPTTPRQSEALLDMLTCCKKLEEGISDLLTSNGQSPTGSRRYWKTLISVSVCAPSPILWRRHSRSAASASHASWIRSRCSCCSTAP